MSRAIRVSIGLAVLALIGAIVIGFGRRPANTPRIAAPGLEEAAIARGLIRDPTDIDPTGLYARDTDRLCVVRGDADAYRVGVFIDYGDGIACGGAGTAIRQGGALRFNLGSGCTLDARFDGDRIAFPGEVPDACASLCTARASLSGLDVTRLSESASEASAMRDRHGKLPCAAR